LVARKIGITEWFRVTQERIAQFAEATEDRQWIHLNQARASKESPYSTTIAHGFLTLSMISHFLNSAIEVQSGVRFAVNYGLNRAAISCLRLTLRFQNPVACGAARFERTLRFG